MPFAMRTNKETVETLRPTDKAILSGDEISLTEKCPCQGVAGYDTRDENAQ